MDAAREGERERRVGATLFRCDLHQQATIKWLSPRQWAPADARTRVQLTVSAVFRAVKSVIRLEIAAAPFGKFAGIFWHFCFFLRASFLVGHESVGRSVGFAVAMHLRTGADGFRISLWAI